MQCGCFLSGFSSQSEIDKEVFKGKKANHYDYEDDDERQKILENEKYIAILLLKFSCSSKYYYLGISKQNNAILVK